MAVEFLRSAWMNLSLYARGFSGLLISLPIILKTIYMWGQIMRDRQYKDVLEKMKEISEKNKDLK